MLNQTYEKAKLCGYSEQDIALVNAEKKEELKILNIAMVQSLNRNLDKYDPDSIECIIVDEAHHATAPSYKNIFKHFQIFEKCKNIYGFTATPLRGDKNLLSTIFFSHTYKMTLSEATQLGYIVPVNGVRIEIDKSLENIDQIQGDYDVVQLDKVMNCESINSLISEKCKFLSKTPGIVFCTSIDHAEKIAKKLRDDKRKAISVSYKTPKKTLERIFKFLRQGKIDFITNAVKLSEGFDYPPIQSVILARPTRSPVLYKQMIGRGLRNYKDKHECYVLEFTANDPQMIKWEEIDSQSTFQSFSIKDKENINEAKKTYKSIFKSPNVEILDVRVSPFDFYECKIRRLIKYKSWFFYVPFQEGFSFYEIKKASSHKSDRVSGNYFNMYGSMFFWKEKYKTFYAWDEYNVLMNPKGSQPINELLKAMKAYAQVNKLGKWYPSEYQKPDRLQIKIMQKLNISKISSARKAEMEIEEKTIQMGIDKYLSKGIFSGIMDIFT